MDAHHGHHISAEPVPAGSSLWAWIISLVTLLAVGAFIYTSWPTATGPQMPPPPAGVTP